jgi:hypothetical protein
VPGDAESEVPAKAPANVIVSGAPGRLDPVVSALRAVGYTVLTASTSSELADTAARLGPGSVEAYVQLPVDVASQADSAVVAMREFLTQGLLARFDAVGDVMPTLREGGTIVLVAGNTPGEQSSPDDGRARLALLRVLSHAALADAGDRHLRAIVLNHGTTADDAVRAVRGGDGDRQTRMAEFIQSSADVSYDDWKLEFLSLVSNES